MADATKAEDYLLERKSKNDLKDLLKTMVAFANSVRPGHVATILIGERDDGTPEDLDPDQIQKTVRTTADKIYPPIIWRAVIYEKGGKQCVRVEIEHSGDTPHFGGPAVAARRGASGPRVGVTMISPGETESGSAGMQPLLRDNLAGSSRR
jgi:predicted HTH transcriptional regulator